MRYLLLISIAVAQLITATGCTSLREGVWLHSTPYIHGGIPAVYNHSEELSIFDFTLTRKGDSIDGMVVVKSESESSKRIVMTSFFGMTFLDFELDGRSIKINYCIEQMNRERIILLLKKDFEILFKPDHSPVTKYVFNLNGEITALQQGNGITRTVMHFENYLKGYPNEIKISHPLLGIKLTMIKRAYNEN
ncbi:MAG: hypothetical protein BGO30_06155 [Bacteroidetes bacterium 41-46]|jgi:hypothetical protein|nr:MAG: hypothetical protein BGO30_06155 [Bacteroidetes bacterium 41-46]